jgi:hypothetical protein
MTIPYCFTSDQAGPSLDNESFEAFRSHRKPTDTFNLQKLASEQTDVVNEAHIQVVVSDGKAKAEEGNPLGGKQPPSTTNTVIQQPVPQQLRITNIQSACDGLSKACKDFCCDRKTSRESVKITRCVCFYCAAGVVPAGCLCCIALAVCCASAAGCGGVGGSVLGSGGCGGGWCHGPDSFGKSFFPTRSGPKK